MRAIHVQALLATEMQDVDTLASLLEVQSSNNRHPRRGMLRFPVLTHASACLVGEERLSDGGRQ